MALEGIGDFKIISRVIVAIKFSDDIVLAKEEGATYDR